MQRLSCPSCRTRFPITPGKAVKCPGCGKRFAVTIERAAVDDEPPRRGSRSRESAPKRGLPVVLMVAAAVGLVAIGGAAVVVFRPSARTSGQVDRVAERPAPRPIVVSSKPTPTVSPEDALGEFLGARKPADKASEKPNDVPAAPEKLAGEAPPAAMPDAVPAKKDRAVAGVSTESVQNAIRKGTMFLGANSAMWLADRPHRLGHIALTGLTLVECKVIHNDPVLQLAIDAVRKLAPASEDTYDIALSILFLDRIGEARDRALIQTLGIRLVAGQHLNGGYHYKCPILTPQETAQLLAFLQRTRPRQAPAPTDAGGSLAGPVKTTDPLDPFANGPGGEPKEKDAVPDPMPIMVDGIVSQPPKIRPKSRLDSDATVRVGGATAPTTTLSQRLLAIPAVMNQGRDKNQLVLLKETRPTDQSNLQFAVIGMWAARRHGVASDRALLIADAYLRRFQGKDGRWPYAGVDDYSETMTCSGMLTLAVGHAVYQSHPLALYRELSNDPQIALATSALARYVHNPQPNVEDKILPVSPFFLWSVERVAMIFNLPTIEGKDWYGWGAQMFIQHQNPDGSWTIGFYPGSNAHTDTCFGLLFLVRSNLVQDLTEYIQLVVPRKR